MNFQTIEMLKKMGSETNPLRTKELNQLDELGYCLLEPSKSIMSYLGKDLDYMRSKIDYLLDKEGELSGYEGREEFYKKGKKFEPIASRLGNLPNKDRVFMNFVMLPHLLWSSFHIIKRDIMLSSSNFREPLKGSGQQRLHIDWKPLTKNSTNYECVIAMMYLDDSKKENGAIKVVPGSHKLTGYPDQYCNPYLEHKKSLTVEAKAGSIIILNCNIWHRGSENISGERRRIINAIYRWRSLKQGLNQKMYIDDKIKDGLKNEEKYFLKIRDNDPTQEEKIYGPGNDYRDWLKKNTKFNFSSFKNIISNS